MADALISDLSSAAALADADLVEVEQGIDPDNTSGKLTLELLAAFINGKLTIPTVFPYDLVVALGDEATVITAGIKVTMRVPRAMTLSSVRASLGVTSSSGIPTIDVKLNGVSIFSTKLTVDVGELTSSSASIPAVLSTTALAADDILTFIIDIPGTSTAGVKVSMIGTAT